MLPRLPLLPLPTYGILVALGFLVGLTMAEWIARRRGVPARSLSDLGIGACFAGLVGAKLVLLVLEPAWRKPWQLLFQGGVFYGGLLAAIGYVLWAAPRAGLHPEDAGDHFAAPLSVGHAIGRLGCFLAGCCWGKECDLPWAVAFTHPESMPVVNGVPPGTRLHPTQLYEVAADLAIAVLGLVLLKRRRFVGQAWWTSILAYAIFRTWVETLRADPRGTWLDGRISTSQGIGIVAALVAAVMLVRGFLRGTPPAPRESAT